MAEAIRRGSGCVVAAGDSRMVAGVSEPALRAALAAEGKHWCVASIAVGALPIHGIRTVFREYLRRGGEPRFLVLGVSEDTLLKSPVPPDPASFVGNEAIALTWSEAGDVFELYPDFPVGSVRAFDQGFRFLAARTTALGSYASLVWQKVHALQNRVTGPAQRSNSFGALADMEALGRRMEANARERLTDTMRQPAASRLDPAFLDLEERARACRARLVLVALPMPEAYRQAVTESEPGGRYRSWLGERLPAQGAAFVDLTHPGWLRPESFADFIHLNADGAARFSTDLARVVARSQPQTP
jgi:hypothetical protein